MIDNLQIIDNLWDKLPDELKIYIFDIIYKNFDTLETILNFQNIRQLCHLSNLKFKQELIESKNRLECRESMCHAKLANYCLFGRYCSLDCYCEHIMYG